MAPDTQEKQDTATKNNGKNQADAKKDAKEKSASRRGSGRTVIITITAPTADITTAGITAGNLRRVYR